MGWYPEVEEQRPKKPKTPDPDATPSTSRIIVAENGRDYRYCLHIKGLGVLMARATVNPLDPNGRLKLEGFSLFTVGEIGFAPEL